MSLLVCTHLSKRQDQDGRTPSQVSIPPMHMMHTMVGAQQQLHTTHEKNIEGVISTGGGGTVACRRRNHSILLSTCKHHGQHQLKCARGDANGSMPLHACKYLGQQKVPCVCVCVCGDTNDSMPMPVCKHHGQHNLTFARGEANHPMPLPV